MSNTADRDDSKPIQGGTIVKEIRGQDAKGTIVSLGRGPSDYAEISALAVTVAGLALSCSSNESSAKDEES